MSNCDCLKTFLAKITENLKGQLSEKESATFRAEWQNAALIFEGNAMVMKVSVPVAYNYQRFKKSGEPHKNLTRDTVNMLMSYCPFCGCSLKSDEEHSA